MHSVEQPHQPGRWHALTIACRGSSVTVDVDGTNVISLVDPNPLSRGQLGLETLDDSEVYVDDITVCP